MKRNSLLGLAFLLALAPVRAAETLQAPARIETGLSPLGQLGSAIGSALPSLGMGLPAGLAPEAGQLPALPAALDTAKAAVLLRRSSEAGLVQTPAAPVQGERPGAGEVQKLLMAVNAPLREFSPEALEKLPLEDLHGLAAVVLDQMPESRAASGGSALDGLAVLARAQTERILGLRGKPMKEILHNPGHPDTHPDDITVYGVPETVRRVLPHGEDREVPWWARSKKPLVITPETVFRHYTLEEDMRSILASGRIWNGFMPYVELSPSLYHKSYDDLRGVFFTLPGVGGDRVGVPNKGGMARTRYIDAIIPAALPLLEIEAGAIYMIPLPARTRGWVRDYYLSWMNGGSAGHYEKMVREMDAEGGPGPDLEVPLKIVGHGEAR